LFICSLFYDAADNCVRGWKTIQSKGRIEDYKCSAGSERYESITFQLFLNKGDEYYGCKNSLKRTSFLHIQKYVTTLIDKLKKKAIILYRILVGRPEGKRLLGRRRHRWVDNIKMDLREIGWDGMDWIDLVQDRD
jgi:hypothetical protein